MPKMTVEMLTGTMARSLSAAVNQSGGRVQRLAQGRKELGRCKIVINFDALPGWADNAKALQDFLAGPYVEWKALENRSY